MGFFWYFLIFLIIWYVLSRSATREATRIYQFITNNHASFHFWWKKNLVSNQKLPKHYDHGCLQSFLLLFLSSLTVSIVENSHIFAGIYFIFPSLKGFQYQILTSVKRSGKQLTSKTNFSFFYKLVALVLG